MIKDNHQGPNSRAYTTTLLVLVSVTCLFICFKVMGIEAFASWPWWLILSPLWAWPAAAIATGVLLALAYWIVLAARRLARRLKK